MKRLILVLLLCAVGIVASAQEKDSLLVMFWNLENFFDWKDDGGGGSDREFSSRGARFWTKSRFYTKCNAVSKSILWVADSYGKFPDIIGLCEIENRGVLTRLLSSTLLRKSDYCIIHFDSDDRRGIDVALLYRRSLFEMLSESLTTPVFQGEKMRTRDMLQVRMKRLPAGDTLDFIVCHHPSKYGGSEVSQARREAAMNSLVGLCDSLGNTPKIVMGDFNDVPSATQFEVLQDRLINKASGLHSKALGTIRYKGKWELIDMFMVDEYLDSLSQMDILHIPFLMTYDRSYPGEKPLRTFSGPRYIGGVSDHCPIILKILLPLEDFR